jgi:uroporphyrinogen-III synthase
MSGRPDLDGLRIVVTRPEGQGEDLAQALRSVGALPLLLPTVRIEALAEVPGLEQAIRHLQHYDWVIFTSANGVEIFWGWLARLGLTESAMSGLGVAAIGPATSDALRERKVVPAFVPRTYVGEALAVGLPWAEGSGILLPRAAESRPALPRMLRARGAKVNEFALYRTVRLDPDPRALEALQDGVDAITFTSPSTMRGFVDMLQEAKIDPFNLPGAPVAACIGPVTAQATAQAGLTLAVVAESYTVAGLVGALTAYYREQVTL